MYELQTWMGVPSIYVYDCSSAGQIVDSFNMFASQRQVSPHQALLSDPGDPGSPVSMIRDSLYVRSEKTLFSDPRDYVMRSGKPCL